MCISRSVITVLSPLPFPACLVASPRSLLLTAKFRVDGFLWSLKEVSRKVKDPQVRPEIKGLDIYGRKYGHT